MSSAALNRTVLVLGLGSMAVAASLRATDPLLAGLAKEFHTTPGQAANASTAFFIAYGLMQLVHGPLGDRFGKLKVMGTEAGLAAFATLLCAMAPNLDALVAARFFTGLFVGAVVPLALAWIGDWVPYEDRQATLARIMVGQVTGVSLGLAAGGWFAEHLSWRWSFVLIACLLGTTSAMIWRALRANPLHGKPPSGTAQERSHALALLRNAWARVVLAGVFVEAMFAFGAMSFVPLHMHRSLGLDLGTSGALVSLIALGGLAYAVSARRLVQRFGEMGLVGYGGLAGALCFVLVAFAPRWLGVSGALFLIVPALVAQGIGLYALHGTLQVHATQMAPEARGAGVSTFAFFLFLGQSLGTFIGSRFVDSAGTVPLLLAASAGTAILAIAFRWLLVRRAS